MVIEFDNVVLSLKCHSLTFVMQSASRLKSIVGSLGNHLGHFRRVVGMPGELGRQKAVHVESEGAWERVRRAFVGVSRRESA